MKRPERKNKRPNTASDSVMKCPQRVGSSPRAITGGQRRDLQGHLREHRWNTFSQAKPGPPGWQALPHERPQAALRRGWMKRPPTPSCLRVPAPRGYLQKECPGLSSSYYGVREPWGAEGTVSLALTSSALQRPLAPRPPWSQFTPSAHDAAPCWPLGVNAPPEQSRGRWKPQLPLDCTR